MTPTSGISRRIEAIYNRFYKKRIRNRFRIYKAVYAALEGEVQRTLPGYSLELDEIAVAEAIRSYFLDVIRYKEYHFNPERTGEKPSDINPLSIKWIVAIHKKKRINSNKVAALSVKWLLMYKPISVRRNFSEMTSDKENYLTTHINEFFALSVGLYALDLSIQDLDSEIVREIVYNLRFRDYDEGAYFMIFKPENLKLKDT